MTSPDIVTLDRGYYTTCTVNLYGATIVSWIITQQEQLYVSKQVVFDGKKPIRGGIAIIFPHFGKWKFGPKHGFARLVRWTVEKPPTKLKSGDVEAVFSTTNSEFTHSMWNYPFKITYKLLLLERELHLDICVENIGEHFTFDFNFLLQTYYKVPNITECRISGLHGSSFIDLTVETPKDRRVELFPEKRKFVIVKELINRVYRNTSDEYIITNTMLGNKMSIQKFNLSETLIWNPWLDGMEEITDMANDEYLKMICLKLGHVSERVKLLPGTSFEASQKLKYIIPINPKFDLEFPCPLNY